ncbi:cytochrome c oxidase assembly protein COX18, mitochondrial-like [Actinia tenebrosa]|uniref:Cytochrome c oxidase assembly protein COX18, mitochondrial-like n=1 Tax=Actinia tenebrosa TaxID=6105 RepID=A0A6P8IF21_ACTTE|nr:cytochrome c oxidase assembly protein COX18, mitochondrial-like [Actinia tenebrosa]
MWWLRIRPSPIISKALVNINHKWTLRCTTCVVPKLINQKNQPCRQSSSGISHYFSQDFTPIYLAQQTLESIHSFTHLPWWGVILGATFFLRTIITLPLAVRQNKLVTKIELLQPTLKMMSEALKYRIAAECKQGGKTAAQFDAIYKKKHRRMMYELYQNEGCNPIKMFLLPWIQLPLWIIISLAIRNMTGTSYMQTANRELESSFSCPEMSNEGFLWFPDLLVPDPLMILPAAVGLFNLTNIEIHALRRQQPSRNQRIFTNSLRTMSIAMIFLASQVPCAMSLYWAASAGYGVGQNILMRLPKVRRRLGIPKTPSESKTPLKDLKKLLDIKVDSFIQKQRQDPWDNKK